MIKRIHRWFWLRRVTYLLIHYGRYPEALAASTALDCLYYFDRYYSAVETVFGEILIDRD